MITKQQPGNTLLGMAEILYDKVEDYKTYILSLLFFKRLSDQYQRYLLSEFTRCRYQWHRLAMVKNGVQSEPLHIHDKQWHHAHQYY